MIDLNDFSKMNEYDEIILKQSSEQDKMKFLVLEDLKNKCWIVYNSENGLYSEFPFGEISAEIIDEYINYSGSAIHHNKLIDDFKKFNIDKSEEEVLSIFKEAEKPIQYLMDIFLNISYWKSCVPTDELKAIMLYEWKRFRYANFSKLWLNYASCEFCTKEDYETIFKKAKTPEAIEELYQINKESAKELSEDMNKVVQKHFLVYCDEMMFIDKDNRRRFGRCFVTPDFTYIFCWDLYHIIVSGAALLPHICPRCKQLFFSNNNKVIYCDDCKAESNTIRNENRMKSVRYIHKKIYDKINNSKFYDDNMKEQFLAESNYYWDIVKKKPIIKNPLFTEKIETEEQYKKWLENKLKSL